MSAHILIVDDSLPIRLSVRFILEHSGFTVFDAPGGTDGLRVLGEQSVQLVLADMIMPDMDGVTMIQKIRESEANSMVPILALATESELWMAQKGRRAGATDLLQKPFNRTSLLDAVERALGTAWRNSSSLAR